VSGYVGVPSLHRNSRSYITLFVNRRWFQDSSVAYGVIQAYHTLLPAGRYPVALIFIEMDPADVDVNVHPTKAEVRFRDGHAVFSAVQRAVRRTLADHAPVPQAGLGDARPGDSSRPSLTWQQLAGWSERHDMLLGAGRSVERPMVSPAASPPDSRSGREMAWPSPAEPARPDAPAAQAPGPELLAAGHPPLLPLLRVVGQLAATYIVAEGPDGMYLIDQHAAHERILYDELLAAHSSHKLAVQQLLEPVLLDLSPEQAAIVAEELAMLNELGVAIEPFGGQAYLVRSVPAVLSHESPQSALAEIIDGLAEQTDAVAGAHETHLVTLICKRAAVKAGQVLSLVEMQEMVRQLEACRSPRTCPHGRPTMIYLSAGELARQFGRM
jgi:DNA mismatch repair protein MutL